MSTNTLEHVRVTDSSIIAGIQGIPLGASRVAAIVTLGNSGKSYMYLVTRSTYVEFLAAESKGRYYNRTIKGGGHQVKFLPDLSKDVIDAALNEWGVGDIAERRPDGSFELLGIAGLNAPMTALFGNVVADAPFAFE